MRPRRRPSIIGLDLPRLSRKEEWGHWRISVDRKTLGERPVERTRVRDRGRLAPT